MLFGEHMNRKKVYIAGPMSGLPDCNRPAFNLAAQVQKSLTHIVLNPATLPAGLSEPEYMQIGITMLMCADMVYMLDGWEQSHGARAEHALAQKLSLHIVYQEGIDHEIALIGLTGEEHF
ncbi:hypothetical protein GCM10009347_01770 [Shewanella algicola]|nr:hypothetical protein GCM10009347_01770 [Shewanella algicola]